MPNANTITIVGHLGDDASMKDIPAGHVTEFSVAVNYGKKDNRKTSWFDVECWHESAKGAQHLRKGDAVVCVGKMRQDRWTNSEGEKRTKWKMVADTVGKVLYVKDDPASYEGQVEADVADDSVVPF